MRGKIAEAFVSRELAFVQETDMNPMITLVNWPLQAVPTPWNNVMGGDKRRMESSISPPPNTLTEEQQTL